MNDLSEPARPEKLNLAMARLMGLAVFGEQVAARTYVQMASLKPDFAPLLRNFASMEGRHGSAFDRAARLNGVTPDRAFAQGELGYLVEQVDEYHGLGDFEALAVLQGFIVESLAIATYEPFLEVADRYPGTREAFETALTDEKYHVDWVIRYLRLTFFDRGDAFADLVGRVNSRGIDCVGGTMMNIADCLDAVGMSGAKCTGLLMDTYAHLLEDVGVDSSVATGNVVSLFMPLMRKYRQARKDRIAA